MPHHWHARRRGPGAQEAAAGGTPGAGGGAAPPGRAGANPSQYLGRSERPGRQGPGCPTTSNAASEADPDCLPATLTLLERYRTADNPKDWYLAAAAAAQRFPGNVAALQQAVDAAVARNAYKKAAGFARQVLTADPINLPVRHRMIELQLAYARKQMRSGRADLAVKAMAEAAQWERRDAPSAPLRIGRALAAMTASSGDAAPNMLRAAVQEEGGRAGCAVGWFHAALEASLMGWPEERLHPLRQELEAATKGEPDRAAILASSACSARRRSATAGGQSRRPCAASNRSWNGAAASPGRRRSSRRSRSCWPICANSACCIAMPARHCSARPAITPLASIRSWRGAKGDYDRLTAVQEGELRTLLQQAGERQDFRLCNRVQRWLFGPEVTRAGRGSLPPSATEEPVSEAEMAEMMAAIGASKPILPPKEVRAMVNELGRDLAINALVEAMANSPMADMLTEEQMARLCAALVVQALDNRPRPARRR